MSIKVQTEFVRQGTVRLIVYVYDDDGVLAAATSVAVSVAAPDGTIVKDEQAMSSTSTGIYEYFFTTAKDTATGKYQVEAIIVKGSYNSMVSGHFTLTAGINEA